GKIKDLRAKYGHLSQVQGLPDFTITHPNLVIKPPTGAIKKGGNQA
ncbi:DMSO/selenate family reductase complex B subunit, partial [Escherichia coli]